MTSTVPFHLVRLGALVLALATLGCGASTTTAPQPAAMAVEGANPAVQAALVDACYACHSEHRQDPWYAKLAPSSWPRSARRVLDFSAWPSYGPEQRAAELAMIATAVRSGSMPPGDYTFFNGAAKLGDAQKQAIIDWASRPQAAAPAH